MTVAHLAGVPVEEVALAITAAGTTALVAMRASLQARLASLRRRARP
jgi:hypothetical protein